MKTQRGFKQGDPVSPILFNLVIDEILDDLDRMPYKGTLVEESIKLSAMAFADDLIILL